MPLTSARFSLAWKRLSVCLVGAALAWGGVTAAGAVVEAEEDGAVVMVQVPCRFQFTIRARPSQ